MGAPSVGLDMKNYLGAKSDMLLGSAMQSVGHWSGVVMGSGKPMELTRSHGGPIYDKKIYIS